MGNNKNKVKRHGAKAPGVNFRQQKPKGKRLDRKLQSHTAGTELTLSQENPRHSLPQYSQPDIKIPGPLLHDSPSYHPRQPPHMGRSSGSHMDGIPAGFSPHGLPPQQLSSPGFGDYGMPSQRLSSSGMEYAPAPGSALRQQQYSEQQQMQMLPSPHRLSQQQRSVQNLSQQQLSAQKLSRPDFSPHHLSQQLQQSQRQVDQLLGEIQQWQANVNAVCREQEVLQSANMALMAENENLRRDNAQLLGQVGQLEQQVYGLNNRLRSFLNGDKSGVDKTYSYDRMRMVELSQLLSCHIYSKSPEIDANRIHGCLRRCASSAKKLASDNPPNFAADYLMLMTTARACTWWTEKQLADIGEWLLLGQSLDLQPAPAPPVAFM